MNEEMRIDCFAYNAEQHCCEALTVTKCAQCVFYKPRAQYASERAACEARLARQKAALARADR